MTEVLPRGLQQVSTARHPVVPTRQLALTESLRAQQILKGLFVEVDGRKYALPIDSWEDRTVFLGVKMWNDGNLAQALPSDSIDKLNSITGLMAGITAETFGVSLREGSDLVLDAVREATPEPLTLKRDPLPYRTGAVASPARSVWQRKALAWLRDNVHQDIPARYYEATLGHDLHVSTFADLYGKHQHMGWASPFDVAGETVVAPLDPTFQTYINTHWPSTIGEYQATTVQHLQNCRLRDGCPALSRSSSEALAALQECRGFVENLGWLSGAKVTAAFVSEEIDELVSTTGTEYADFDHHEVGTSTTAESNAHTALQTTTGIARAAGTPTDADPIYRSVATITADTSETWQEHGIFNNAAGAAMMDRNLTGGQAVVNTDQVQYTFELTKTAEA